MRKARGSTLRICLVSYEFPPSGGGEASYVYSLAAGLGRLGHEVLVIAPMTAKPEIPGDLFKIIPTRPGHSLIREMEFLAQAERTISRLADDRRVDVVHVTFDYPTFFINLKSRVPCVATVHHLHKVEALSMLPHQKHVVPKIIQLLKASILTSLEGNLVRQCDATIAVSNFTAESVRRHLSVARREITIVKNGIETSEFENGDRERFRRVFPQAGEKSALFVGRLERSKGLDYLIPAFARVSDSIPGATLVVVGRGGGGYLRELKSLATRLGVRDKVLFTGRIPQGLLPDAYAAASLVVLPSLMEGFGISLLESMAAGRPCVATRVGAIPEVVKDGESGLLVAPANSRELGDAMIRILSDDSLAASLGKKGKERANRDFTLEKMVMGTVEVYRAVIERATAGKSAA